MKSFLCRYQLREYQLCCLHFIRLPTPLKGPTVHCHSVKVHWQMLQLCPIAERPETPINLYIYHCAREACQDVLECAPVKLTECRLGRLQISI